MSCDELVFVEDRTPDGTDAIIETSARFHAEFTGVDTGAIGYAISIDCIGEECAGITESMGLLETPCNTQAEANISHTESR